MADPVQVPTGVSGVVTRLEGISFCMDGATHIIHTVTGAIRLKAREPQLAKALDSIADGTTQVLVMGYLTWGAECMHLLVFHIARVPSVNKALLGDDLFPWPWDKVS